MPREEPAVIATLLDAGYKQLAFCTKILGNSPRGPIPVIDVSLYHPESNAPREAVAMSWGQGSSVHQSDTSHRPAEVGPVLPGWVILLLLLIFGFVLFLAIVR